MYVMYMYVMYMYCKVPKTTKKQPALSRRENDPGTKSCLMGLFHSDC